MKLAADVREICSLDCDFLASARRLEPGPSQSLEAGPPYKLAFLGRWHPNKGVDILMHALRQLAEEDWAAISEVRIHGGGPLRKTVTSIASELMAAGRPVVVGDYLGKQDARSLIDWANYLLLPSRVESIPVVFSDAVQLKTPIIAMPVGDLPELHQKYRFGILANEMSTADFANAIGRAVRSPAEVFESGLQQAQPAFDVGEIVGRFLSQSLGISK